MPLDLFEHAAVAEILGAGSLVFALLVGAYQIKQFRRDRKDRSAAELMQMFQTPEYVSGMLEVVRLPEGAKAQNVRERGPKFEKTAAAITLIL